MKKTVLAIHDLSCYAKSSLTVVLPVLEALGVECAVLPTAILSTQTDGYDDVYLKDETDAMEKIISKHNQLGIEYDGIYSGFLGSDKQIDIVKSIMHKSSALKLVDPVLGDNGELYSTITDEHVKRMSELVACSDLITPNYTEALILTGIEKKEVLFDADIKHLVSALCTLGPKSGVITSVPLGLGSIANIAYTKKETRIFPFTSEKISYPGSGDLFAAIFFSLIVKGRDFFSSAAISTDISSECVRYSFLSSRERRRGVDIQPLFDDIRRRVL